MNWIAPSDEKVTVKNFDAMIWSLVEEDKGDRIERFCVQQAFKTDIESDPTDLGFKYYICTFKNKDSVELVKAIVGDPQAYISRLSRLGYNGLMIKHSNIPVRTSKKMIKTMLSGLGIEDKLIKTILKQV